MSKENEPEPEPASEPKANDAPPSVPEPEEKAAVEDKPSSPQEEGAQTVPTGQTGPARPRDAGEPAEDEQGKKPEQEENRAWDKKAIWRTIQRSSIFRALLIVLLVVIFPYLGNALWWPMRVVIILLCIWLVPAVIRDADWLVDQGGQHFRRLWGSLCALCRKHRRVLGVIELLGCLVLVSFSALHLFKMYGAMSSVSLRQDEIGAIDQYTSESPFEAATKYNLAKNHIFYSVLNSITPGSESKDPLRGRLWSFVAVSVALFGGLAFFWWRRQFIEGALVFSIPAMNAGLLETLLEARGYSFIALFAGASAICMLRYLETRKLGWLLALGVATFLGTWTLPYYVLFGGVLLLLLFLLRPRRETFLVGLFTLLAIAVVHALVFGQMLQVATSYEEDYGVKFTELTDIYFALHYLFPWDQFQVSSKWLLGFIFVLIMAPHLLRRRASPVSITLQTVFVVSFGFYLYCLIIGTPPTRTTSFVPLALVVCLALLVNLLTTQKFMLPLRLPVVALILLVTIPWAQSQNANFFFIAKQKWLEGGRIIEALLPSGAVVWAMEEYDGEIDSYLPLDRVEVRRDGFDPAALPKDEPWTFFDPYFKGRHLELRQDLENFPRGTRYVTLPLRNNYHRIFFRLPKAGDDGVVSIETAGERALREFEPSEPQPYDPSVLALSDAASDPLFEDDDDAHAPQLAAATEQTQANDGHKPETPGSRVEPAPNPATETGQQGEPAGGIEGYLNLTLQDPAEFGPKKNLAILFTRTLGDQQVRAVVEDRYGFSLELGPGDLLTEGELLIVPLEEIPNATEVTIHLEPAKLPAAQRQRYELVEEPRPLMNVVDAWVTPVPEESASVSAEDQE